MKFLSAFLLSILTLNFAPLPALAQEVALAPNTNQPVLVYTYEYQAVCISNITPKSSFSTNAYYFGSKNGSSNPYWGLYQQGTAAKKLRFDHYNGSSDNYFDSSTTFALDTTYMVTLTKEGDICRLYVNGSLEHSQSGYSTRNFGGSNNNKIGAATLGGTVNAATSYLDDFSVFSRALSSTEVSNLYTGNWVTSVTIQDLNYTYDANNNLTQISDISDSDTAKTTYYTYDSLNRLATASSTNAATSTNYYHQYAYDGIGNITSSTPAGVYGYATTTSGYVNPHAAIWVGTSTYSYDTNGNLTSDGLWAHTWDYRNRLTQSTKTGATTTYGYDSSNTRVRMVSASTTLIVASQGYSTENGEAVKYISANGQLIATLRGSGTSTVAYYTHPDHLGSEDKTTNDTPEISSLADYLPYGAIRQSDQSILAQRKKFIGVDFDESTGLSQAGARYYKSEVGRFISQDPVFWEVGVKKEANMLLSNPQALNSYAYGNNNPIVNKDPNGRCVGPLVAICIGGAVGFVGGIANQAIGDIISGGFGNRSWRENLNTYAVAAGEGTVIGAGIAAAGLFAPAATIGIGGAILATGATAGVLTFGTGILGDKILGEETDYSSLAVDSAIAAATGGVFRALPQVSGRMPNFGTRAFFAGAHTARQGAEDFLNNNLQTLSQSLVRTVQQTQSSGGRAGGGGGSNSALISALQGLISALQGYVASQSSSGAK
jgi:RHS repeat-associated protein